MLQSSIVDNDVASETDILFRQRCRPSQRLLPLVDRANKLSPQKLQSGNGVFYWPNGDAYSGDFVKGRRHGSGIQRWSDGSLYRGEFEIDLKHGSGTYSWANGEVYEGQFFRDRMHGRGEYRWPNGCSFLGTFFMDKKEGYGTFTFRHGDKFEGLYKAGEREGPGVLFYANGHCDVGIWQRNHIVKLCSSVAGAFRVRDWWPYPLSQNDHRLPVIAVDLVAQQLDRIRDVIRSTIPPDPLNYDWQTLSQNEILRHLVNIVLPSGSLALDIHPFAEAFNAALVANLTLSDIADMTGTSVGSLINSRLEVQMQLSDSAGGRRTRHSTRDALHSSRIDSKALVRWHKLMNKSTSCLISPSKSVSMHLSDLVMSMSKNLFSSIQLMRTSSSEDTLASSGVELSIPNVSSASLYASLQSPSTPTQRLAQHAERLTETAWNNTPSCIRTQQHMMRFRHVQQEEVSFDVREILSGRRSMTFGAKGQQEMLSELFIRAASKGDLEFVENTLSHDEVHVDVADRYGHTALIAATFNGHCDVINCLLNYGADVNKMNDDGVSALVVSYFLLYPIDSFSYNTAERYLEVPSDLPSESKYRFDKMRVVPKWMKWRIEAHKRSSSKLSKKSQRSSGRDITSTSMSTFSPFSVATTPGPKTPAAPTPRPVQILGRIIVRRVPHTDVDELMLDREIKPIAGPQQKQTKQPLPAIPSIIVAGPDAGGDSAKVGRQFGLSSRELQDVSARSLVNRNSDRQVPLSSDRNLQGYRTSSVASGAEWQLELEGRITGVTDSGDQLHSSERPGFSRCSDHIRYRFQPQHPPPGVDSAAWLRAQKTSELLLRRGADPDASIVPMPVLFFAIKSGDVEGVRRLLIKGASPNLCSPKKLGGLAPLHISCGMPGEKAVKITELLLTSLAFADVRAPADDSYLNTFLKDEWKNDGVSPETAKRLGGRTPLHIACARDDNYEMAWRTICLLLKFNASTDLLCNGHSPLSLGIASGNDLAIDELLRRGADPNLPLSHGLNNALCVASSPLFENRRAPSARLELINKLLNAGADILTPVPVAADRQFGTVIDYNRHVYGLDGENLQSQTPLHKPDLEQQEVINIRQDILRRLATELRDKVARCEKQLLMYGRVDKLDRCMNFLYVGMKKEEKKKRRKCLRDKPVVDFGEVSRPLFLACNECGRSVGVELTPCSQCQSVYFCSSDCRRRAMPRHELECDQLAAEKLAAGEQAVDSSQQKSLVSKFECKPKPKPPPRPKPAVVVTVSKKLLQPIPLKKGPSYSFI